MFPLIVAGLIAIALGISYMLKHRTYFENMCSH